MPLINQVHVDTLLSNVSIKYRNESYVAMEIFPEVAVKKTSDLYRVYQRNFRLPHTLRADGAEAQEHSFDVSTASYLLERHSLKDHVSDTKAENYDLADLRAETTEELTDVILRRMENSVATLITTTSWSQNLSLAATAAWNATTTLDPISHTDTGTTTIVNNSGKQPNIIAMGLGAWQALKNNAQILDRVKHTSAEVTEAMLAALIGVDKLVVAKQSQDTSALGAAESISAMWNDAVLLAYRADRPGPLKPSAGYIFRKSLPLTKRWRVEERESEAIEVGMEYQAKVVSSLSGFLIKDVT